MKWIEHAQNLPTGHSARIDCPTCGEGTNTNAAQINHDSRKYTLYCHACGESDYEYKGKQTLAELTKLKELNDEAENIQLSPIELPEDFTEEIPIEGRLWLYKAGISESTWREYGLGYSGRTKRVILPVYDDTASLVWQQCRALFTGQRPKYLHPRRDRGSVMFRAKGTGRTKHVAIVVEDILSAIRVGKHTNCYSLLGTKITPAQAAELSQYDCVVTWLDGDRAGKRGAYSIRRTLSTLTDVANIATDKDPKEYSDVQIREILNEYI